MTWQNGQVIIYISFLFLFLFGLTTQEGVQESVISQSHDKMSQFLCHMIKSHEECGKIVHRLCSSCISSIQEINENSIKFSLSTRT